MWPYNALPKQQLQQKYGFTVSDAWAQRLQRSSVRFDNGGSESFISADGLVMTNHHIALDTLQKLSDATHNYTRDGFYKNARKAPGFSHGDEFLVATLRSGENSASSFRRRQSPFVLLMSRE